MKTRIFIYTVIQILLMSIYSTSYSQGIRMKNKQSEYPAFDKLFKLKWKIEDKEIALGKVLAKDGLVFLPGIEEYFVNGKSGEKKYFKQLSEQEKNDYKLSGYLFVYNKYGRENLLCLKTNEVLLSGSSGIVNLFNGYAKFIDDSIFYYPLTETLVMAQDLNRIRRVLWKYPTEDTIKYRYMKFDTSSIVFTKKDLLLLNAKKGNKEWQINVGELICDPVLLDDNIYFISRWPHNKMTLNSINLREQKKNWSKDYNLDTYFYGFAAEKNRLCFISNEGVQIHDTETGEMLFLVNEGYEKRIISIVDGLIIAYNWEMESVEIATGIDINTGKIKYRYFTSEGFPPMGEENMSDEAKRMKEAGEADWWEGLGYNYLDGTMIHFVKDPKTGLVYASGRGVVYCLEYVK